MLYQQGFSLIPEEQMIGITQDKRKATIGLPAPAVGDKRFPLTPEAAGMLVEKGFCVKIEAGAASCIHYTDLRYQQLGVEIVDRPAALRSDIVLSLAPLSTYELRMLKPGATLFSLFESVAANPQGIAICLRDRITIIALDLICDEQGHKPFADIISEISGRAAIAIASSLLADAVHGKGILLGGVAGIIPCEVTIMGSGIDAIAAARSAIGLGAMVRIFDNDVYRLRAAMHELGPGAVASAFHPRVLQNALRTADVVVATEAEPQYEISADVVYEMKKGAIIFDLYASRHRSFPSLQHVDLGVASPADAGMDGRRVCFINSGNAVPRTVAMALSNTFLTLVSDIHNCDGLNNALMMNKGLQRAALTFMGRPVHAAIASILGLRQVDINLLLQFG